MIRARTSRYGDLRPGDVFVRMRPKGPPEPVEVVALGHGALLGLRWAVAATAAIAARDAAEGRVAVLGRSLLTGDEVVTRWRSGEAVLVLGRGPRVG